MSLRQGSTGRLALQVAQTIGTAVTSFYGTPAAGFAVNAAHAAFWGETAEAEGSDTAAQPGADDPDACHRAGLPQRGRGRRRKRPLMSPRRRPTTEPATEHDPERVHEEQHGAEETEPADDLPEHRQPETHQPSLPCPTPLRVRLDREQRGELRRLRRLTLRLRFAEFAPNPRGLMVEDVAATSHRADVPLETGANAV